MIKLLELFGGIGACSAALDRLGIEYEIADYVEIDKYAIKSFNAIHDTNFEPQDITKWDKDIKDLAQEQMVKFFFYNIIYKLKEDVINMLYGSLDPVSVEEDLGEAEVKQTWRHSEVGTIAGVSVTSGKVLRNALARVIRDGTILIDTDVASLQRGKDSAKEVKKGFECGVTLVKYDDFRENDIIEFYELVEVKRG